MTTLEKILFACVTAATIIFATHAAMITDAARHPHNWEGAYFEYKRAADAYIRMLESDLGDDYLDDVACETDAYLDYYKLFNNN